MMRVENRPRERDESADDDAVDADSELAPGPSRDDQPDSATYDPIERRRFGPVGAIPSSRWLTVALVVVFAVLLGYAIWTGNTISVVGMVVIIVFVGLPLLVLTIVNHGRFLPPPPPPTPYPTKDDPYARDDASDGADTPDEREALDGQYPAHLLDEPPGEDGKRHALN